MLVNASCAAACNGIVVGEFLPSLCAPSNITDCGSTFAVLDLIFCAMATTTDKNGEQLYFATLLGVDHGADSTTFTWACRVEFEAHGACNATVGAFAPAAGHISARA